MELAIKIKKNYVKIAIFLTGLIITNFFIAFSFIDEFTLIDSSPDEINHIHAAKNFKLGNNFEVSTLPYEKYVFDETQLPNPEIYEPYKRPILYHLLLGTYFKITDTKPIEYLSQAIIFHLILNSIFLVLFFFVIRKNFDEQIAILSIILILFLNYFIFYSLRPAPIIIFYLFAACALFFLKKKNSHYLLFGLFTGIAHTGAATGIILGTSYCVYLLCKREFKGALLVFLSWNAVLIPVFLRAYYLTKDFGAGLYMPFSNSISRLVDFLPTVATTNPVNSLDNLDQISSSSITPFVAIQDWIQEITLWHADLLISFFGFAFLVFFTIERFHLKPVKAVILSSIILISYLALINNLPQYYVILYILAIPTIFLIVCKCRKQTLFDKNMSTSYIFFFLYGVFNVLAIYFFRIVTENFDPGVKHLTFAIFLFIPLSLFGLKKLLNVIIPSEFRYNKLLISFLLIIILVIPTNIQSLEGFQSLVEPPKIRILEENERQQMNDISNWINQNLEQDSIIASSKYGGISIMTDATIVPIPQNLTCENLPQFIDHFGVNYILLLSSERDNIRDLLTLVFPSVNRETNDLSNAYLLKVTNLDSISFQIDGMLKGEIITLQQIIDNNPSNAATDKKLEEVTNRSRQLAAICKSAIENYVEILLINIDYYKSNSRTFEEFLIYDEVLKQPPDLTKLSIYQKILENLGLPDIAVLIEQQRSILNEKEDVLINSNIQKFDYKETTLADFSSFRQTILFDERSQNIAKKTLLAIKALYPYDNVKHLSSDDKKKIMELHIEFLKKSSNYFSFVSDSTTQKSFYGEIYSVNRTDPFYWLGTAKLYEKEEQYELALDAYDRALSYGADNQQEIKNNMEIIKNKLNGT